MAGTCPAIIGCLLTPFDQIKAIQIDRAYRQEDRIFSEYPGRIMPHGDTKSAKACASTRLKLLTYLTKEREILLCDAMRILGSRDRAEDVVQDAAIRCMESRAIAESIDSPRGFVRRMVKNLALDQCRKMTRENITVLEVGEEPPCSRPGVEKQLEAKQALTLVVSQMGNLPPRHRQIFLSHRLEACLQKDLARRFDLSPARINGIVAQTHSLLLTALQDNGPPVPVAAE